jgi:ribulose kinase
MSLLLALDFGTGGVRAGVFDADARALRGQADAPYPTTHPRPGWAEQSPDDWWRAAVRAVRAATAAAGSRAIAGVSIAATSSTVVAATRAGAPLRPAILWMDCRAARESAITEKVSHPVLAYSGGGDAVEWLVPKAMWLAANEPDVYRNADVICEAIDFMNFRLTGRWLGSRLNATCKWNYDPLRRRFAPDLFEAFGVPDLIDKLPLEIVGVGDAIAPMSAAAAEELGLETRPLLAQGGIDAHIGMLGAGTVAPGGLMMIGGTSNVHLAHASSRPEAPGAWGPYPDALVDGLWLVEGGQVSAGSILTWLSDRIFGLDAAGFAALLREAEARPVGAGGLIILDYWMGNRTPYRDPNLRGAILGLSLWHDRAAIYRAAVEAVALGSLAVVDSLKGAGMTTSRFVLAGGICKNPLWLKATIDALGLPARVAGDENLSLRGAAASAAAALGLFPGLVEAADAFAAPTQLREPDPAAHGLYRDLFEIYRDATTATGPVSHRLANSARETAR